MGIQSCADEVVEELAKDYQVGYDFVLDKFNVPSDHELRVAVKKLDSDDEEKVEEREESEPVEASRANQTALMALIPNLAVYAPLGCVCWLY